jgi:glycopeptide antibiotics resistance protein
MSTARRTPKAGLVLLGAYLACLAAAVLAPAGEVPTTALIHLTSWCRESGCPDALLIANRFEFAANVVVVIPASAIAKCIWSRRPWTFWTAYGFVIAVAIETVQGVALPERSASFADVVANTLGACAGALLGALFLALLSLVLPRRRAELANQVET